MMVELLVQLLALAKSSTPLRITLMSV